MSKEYDLRILYVLMKQKFKSMKEVKEKIKEVYPYHKLEKNKKSYGIIFNDKKVNVYFKQKLGYLELITIEVLEK